ncbi:MAG: BatA domain-containing protein [Sediminibacterium sp.]|nr:BatA domain-containing protein [Sediminibacterium sp.]
MIFAYPAFLWALLAISIPVIIHLFNFRKYKKVYFTNVRFLKALQQESQSRSRLKEWLILAARILAITCLVLAFAQPLLPDRNKTAFTGQKHISIYIDNSFSMEAVNKQGSLLDNAKRKAVEIVNAYGNGDKFQIITNDFEGRQQRLLSKEDALAAIEDIRISPSVKNASQVIKRQSDFLTSQKSGFKQLYLISDLQQSTFDTDAFVNDTSVNVSIVAVKANQTANVYIDSCWFESPVQQKGFILKLHATIANNSDKTIEAGSARLFLNKQPIALSSFSIIAGEEKEIVFSFECKQNGIHYGSIKLEDYPVTFDDELLFTFNSRLNIPTLVINGKNAGSGSYFNTLMQTDSLFQYKTCNENAIDYADFKTASLLVLNEVENLSSGLVSELEKYTRKGGSLVIIPAVNADLKNYEPAYKTLSLPLPMAPDTHALRVNSLRDHPVFYEGVFEKTDERVNLPLITQHYLHQKNTRSNGQTILNLQNGDFFLQEIPVNNSTVYLFSAPLSDKAGNFGKHALFVPTFIKMAILGLKPVPLFYTVKTNAVIPLLQNNLMSETPPHITEINGKHDIIPEMRNVNNALSLFTRQQIEQQGFYDILFNNERLGGLAFNFDRRESNLSVFETGEVSELLQKKNLTRYSVRSAGETSITDLVKQESEGKALWKLFIVLTLLFLLAETLLIRFLK